MKYYLIEKTKLDAIGFTGYGELVGEMAVVPANIAKGLNLDLSKYTEYSLQEIKNQMK